MRLCVTILVIEVVCFFRFVLARPSRTDRDGFLRLIRVLSRCIYNCRCFCWIRDAHVQALEHVLPDDIGTPCSGHRVWPMALRYASLVAIARSAAPAAAVAARARGRPVRNLPPRPRCRSDSPIRTCECTFACAGANPKLELAPSTLQCTWRAHAEARTMLPGDSYRALRRMHSLWRSLRLLVRCPVQCYRAWSPMAMDRAAVTAPPVPARCCDWWGYCCSCCWCCC